jgi:hypothetical protein
MTPDDVKTSIRDRSPGLRIVQRGDRLVVLGDIGEEKYVIDVRPSEKIFVVEQPDGNEYFFEREIDAYDHARLLVTRHDIEQVYIKYNGHHRILRSIVCKGEIPRLTPDVLTEKVVKSLLEDDVSDAMFYASMLKMTSRQS